MAALLYNRLQQPVTTATTRPRPKKYLCFRIVSDKNIGRGTFFVLNIYFLRIVVYYIEVEIVYL